MRHPSHAERGRGLLGKYKKYDTQATRSVGVGYTAIFVDLFHDTVSAARAGHGLIVDLFHDTPG